MPPKKKPKAKKKENAEEKSEKDLEAKYRHSLLNIEILQEHIGLQRASLRQVQTDRAELRRCVSHMEQKLQHERRDRRDVNADLSRQYKTMQTELGGKVTRLESEVSQLKGELAQCEEELRRERRRRQQEEQDKNAALGQLQHKLDNMETGYEKILHETLDSLTTQLSVAQQGWEDKSTNLHQKYKQLLSEFGLNPLDI